jgi:hypothetical protein
MVFMVEEIFLLKLSYTGFTFQNTITSIKDFSLAIWPFIKILHFSALAVVI